MKVCNPHCDRAALCIPNCRWQYLVDRVRDLHGVQLGQVVGYQNAPTLRGEEDIALALPDVEDLAPFHADWELAARGRQVEQRQERVERGLVASTPY